MKPTPGFLYEPRAFWSVGRIESAASRASRPPNVLQLPRADFTNGERFPVTLTKVCIAPVNYNFDRYSDAAAPPLTTANFRNCGVAALEFPGLVIAAPQRQYYAARPGHLQGLTPEPSYTPAVAGQNGSPAFASSLWGLSRWQFDHAMHIPRLGDLDFELSSIAVDGTLVGAPAAPTAAVLFEEAKQGLFGGQGRSTLFQIREWVGPASYTFPFGPDGFGAPTQGNTGAVWPPTSRFSARRYGAENPTSDGSIPVTGFSVMIDQITYDANTFAGHVPAPAAGSVLAPLAFRIAARARMRNGGTGAFWWRQGAPLALVTPTITPAQVYTLVKPITLGPGDSLSLELSVPPPVVIGEDSIPSIYQVGVSLTGFAAIEA